MKLRSLDLFHTRVHTVSRPRSDFRHARSHVCFLNHLVRALHGNLLLVSDYKTVFTITSSLRVLRRRACDEALPRRCVRLHVRQLRHVQTRKRWEQDHCVRRSQPCQRKGDTINKPGKEGVPAVFHLLWKVAEGGCRAETFTLLYFCAVDVVPTS